jgi:hypothetical protein
MEFSDLRMTGDIPHGISREDEANERLIDACYTLMVNADNPDAARTYFYEMLRFVRDRTPRQIFAMEISRRLK